MPQVFGPLELPARYSLNELTARAALDNSWVELNSTLVDTTTEESYDFTNAFSFYSGRDSDGYWSEGGNRDTSLVRSIPAGTYNLVVEEKAEHHHLTNLVATDLKTLAKEALEDVKDTLIEWEVGPRGIIDPKHIHPWRAEKGKT